MAEQLREVNNEGRPRAVERIPRPLTWLIWGLLGGGVIVILLFYWLVPLIRNA